MKKKIVISIILIIFIFFVSSICKSNAEATYSQFKEIQHILNIDTDLNDSVFDKNGIQICGWRLATEKNKIIVKIDGEKIDSNYIEYSYKYDLISIVKGYGTYEENPTPMFNINIPTSDIKDGNHVLEIGMELEDGTILESIQRNIKIEKIKHILNIDTNLENAKFDKYGINISGWRLANESNKIDVLVDGVKIDSNYIEYSYKYDLISIVKGYGTYEENPTPMFDIKIPTKDITNGKHNIKIQLKLKDETILDTVEANIMVNKSVKNVLNIDTNLENAKFDKTGIQISGWRLATEKSKIVVLIDGKEIDEKCISYSYKYDLISIIKGYGTYNENPTPMFDINIPTTKIEDGKHSLELQMKLEDGTSLESIKKDIIVEKFKSILNIDTNLKNAKFDKYGINISGWRLANEKNSIKVLIDNKEIDDKYISYSYKYDLISIVKGYGTYEENSTPMFDINIPTIDITNGEHQIEIQVELENGTIVKKVKNKIIIDKSIKHILNIDTDINGLVFNELKKIQISGWKLATEKGTKLVVYIDNKKIDDSHIKNSRTYDLISIVKGYGTYEENPTPMFEVNISTENISKQNHNIKIQYLAEDGSILDNVEFVAIYGDKYRGIDVSQKNGIVNWRQVANSGIDFAMIRIGYRGYRGATLVLDDQAIYNLREAKSFGIKVGVYFVTQAINLSEAQEEALWVAGQLNKNGIKLEYPVAIDVEDSGARKNGYLPGRADLLDSETRTMLTRAFCDVIKYQGFIPAVYTSKNWFNTHLNYAELTNYDIWVAHYTYDENKQTDFDKNYQVWQYTDKGIILGVSGNVDKNICYKRY